MAPRHIAVDLDGKEVYDVYYANATKSVFDRIQAGVPNLPPPPPEVKGDRPIAERATSPDVRDRVAVETAFQAADPAGRRRLLDAALAAGVTKQLDLLRLSIFGLDPELAKSARAALANPGEPERIAAALAALLPEPSDTGIPDADDRDPRTIVHAALDARQADLADRGE